MVTVPSTSKWSTVSGQILNNIFQRLRYSGSLGQFLPCLLVCKHWRLVGDQTAWKTLLICDENVDGFIASSILERRRFQSTEHLTVSLHSPFAPICECEFCVLMGGPEHEDWEGANHRHRYAKPDSTKEFRRTVNLLANIIETGFVSLVTFSLSIDNEPRDGGWCSCYEPSVPATNFARLIKALPASCVDIDSHTEEDNDHLCTVLGALLPRIHHLRLRLSYLCPCCLPVSTTQGQIVGAKLRRNMTEDDSQVLTEVEPSFDKLLSCTINFILYPRKWRFFLCPQYLRNLERGVKADVVVAVAFYNSL
jgi:hypothetical protein